MQSSYEISVEVPSLLNFSQWIKLFVFSKSDQKKSEMNVLWMYSRNIKENSWKYISRNSKI